MAIMRSGRAAFGLGLCDQGFQSATTAVLMIAGGRSLGPAGLGAIALGFAALLVPVAAQRSLVIDPYVTRIESPLEESRAYAAALTISLLTGAAVAVIFMAGGSFTQGAWGRGLVAFAPWVPAFMIQGLFRAACFRHARGIHALATSAIALLVFVALLALGRDSDIQAIVSAWGLGMSAAAAYALLLTPAPRLVALLPAFRWFVVEAFPLGRWLGAGAAVFTVSSYALLAALSAILGPASIGAYRAIESVFSPLSLLAPGLSNPGVRELRMARGKREEIRIATIIGGCAAIATVAYALILWLRRDFFIDLFGPQFRQYLFLVAPIAVGQTILALPLGFSLLLKVARQGRLYLPTNLLSPLAALVVAPIAAHLGGLEAAAWSIALCTLLSTGWAVGAAMVVAAWEPSRRKANE